MIQQTVHAAATFLESQPPACHLTLLWEHTNGSSQLVAAARSLKKEIQGFQRPVQVGECDEIKLTTTVYQP